MSEYYDKLRPLTEAQMRQLERRDDSKMRWFGLGIGLGVSCTSLFVICIVFYMLTHKGY